MKSTFNFLILLILFCIATFVKAENNRQQKAVFHAIVSQDGSGDFTKIQDAIDAAPENRKIPWLILVKNGLYREQIVVSDSKPFIHLIGQDKTKTIIHHNLNVGGKPEEGIEPEKSIYWVHSVHNPASEVYRMEGAVLNIKAPDFYSENISYINDWGVESQAGPQALALKISANRNAFKNCIFRSFQDTWMTSSRDEDRLYVKDCFIEGAVDYFYGGGDALVENSTFYNVRGGSVIVAPCQTKAAYGYVFRNCIVDGNEASAKGRHLVKLGRPWHNAPKTVYIHTTMRIPIANEGWTNMGTIPALFAEYDSRDAEGNLLDLSQRKTEYECGGKEGRKGSCPATITKEEADKMVYENIILRNDDNWNPRSLMEVPAAPGKLKHDKMKLTWEPVSGATGYIVFDGENILGITTESVWMLSADPQFSIQVCAVSQSGALGEKATLKLVTVLTIGDSTMANYAENTTKTKRWEEMLHEFFLPEIEVMNYARGGRNSHSLYEEGIWDRVKNNLTSSDYVFIQFAHNDKKEGG
jgi:pectinesterase